MELVASSEIEYDAPQLLSQFGAVHTGQSVHLMPVCGVGLAMLFPSERFHPYHVIRVAPSRRDRAGLAQTAAGVGEP